MPKPTFLIIGAPRAGTTSLYEYLRQHPEVFMSPIKEPHFFAFEDKTIDFQGPEDIEVMNRYVVTDWEKYKSLFAGVEDEKAIGEASAMYLYSEEAAQRIHHYLPDVRLIAVLRNPVDRAYSHYLRMRRIYREPIARFDKALEAEDHRVEEGWSWAWHYTRMGHYYDQLKRYMERFDDKQIRVYLHENLRADTGAVARDMYDFIGVSPSFTPQVERHNISGLPKVEWLHRIMEKRYGFKSIVKKVIPATLRKKIKHHYRQANLSKPTLEGETRRRLASVFEKDIMQLEELLQRDLSHWRC